MLGNAQIKVVCHKHFQGVMDKHDTVQPMSVKKARAVLIDMGYEKIREESEDGCTIEIWELPQARQP